VPPCWKCHAAVEPEDLSCPSCRALQPEAPGADLFAALGLERGYDVDPADLERRYRERSRLLHPDRFARATPKERRISLERTTRLNDAYRTLREPRARAVYFLRLLGHDPVAEARSSHDPDFLEEQLEIREELALARASDDSAALERIAAHARDRLLEIEAEVSRLFAEADPGQETLCDIARLLARARYHENVVAEAAPRPATI
jgi:molecular chaperone HscB